LLTTPAAAAFALLVVFFLLRRISQTRRPARRARTARPPTAAPTITPMLDFLAGVAVAGVVEAEEGEVVVVIRLPAGDGEARSRSVRSFTFLFDEWKDN